VRNGAHITGKEAVLLGLPLKYGDTVNGKFFINYEMSRVTGHIGAKFKEPNWAENQRATRMRKRHRVKRFTQRVKRMYGCKNCGYKKCVAALHFHHVFPEEKIESVSQMDDWNAVKKEMRKCIILCANCHSEVEEIERLNDDKSTTFCTET